MRKALPLLAEPEYYISAKYGYARGGMPVAFNHTIVHARDASASAKVMLQL